MNKLPKKYSWIISDGTKGMENQSIALAKLLHCDFKIVNFRPPYFLAKFPLIGKFIPKKIIKINLNQPPFPQFIITTGKRMAGISIFFKRVFKKKIKTIHIHNSKVPNTNFDLLLIPEHDKIMGENIINTKGALNCIDNHQIEKLFTSIPHNLKDKKKPIILVLIGGDNKRYKLKNTDYYNLGLDIINATKKINGKLIVSTSRRTSLKGVKILSSVFKKSSTEYYLWSGLGYNPYPSMLNLSDYIIVTSDSVNMISETANFNIPLFVAYISREKGKIKSFLNNLEKLNIIKNFNGNLFDYKKVKLNTNYLTSLKINKFFSSK